VAGVALLVATALAAAFALIPAPPSAQARASGKCGGKASTKLARPGGTTHGHPTHHNTLTGSERGEHLVGGKGVDYLCGKGGGDVLRGKTGRDRLHGGLGPDRIDGGAGRDRLIAGTGRDVLIGRGGRDRISAADGFRNRIRAGRHADRIRTRDGVRDKVNCGPGRDTVRSDKHDALRGCYRVRAGDAMPSFAVPPWSDVGWSDPSSWDTIQTANLDGKPGEEIWGRSSFGIEAYEFVKPLGQWEPLPPLTGSFAPSDANGWSQPRYYETLQAADLNGDGRDEILGRDSGGIETWSYEPATDKWAFRPVPVLDAFSNRNGWSAPEYFETIHAADLDGDKRAEIYGRDNAGIDSYKLDPGTGRWRQLPHLDNNTLASNQAPSNANGWARAGCYDTLQAADLDGDGTDEVWGRCGLGIYAWKLSSGGWRPFNSLQGIDAPSDARGWNDPSRYGTLQSADLNGDKRAEIIGRDGSGVQTWAYNPQSGFWDDDPVPRLPAFADAEKPQYYLTIHTADLDGDGRPEVYGREADGLHAWTLRESGGWRALPVLGDLCDACGWDRNRYYRTIQAADVDGGGRATLLARGLTGVLTRVYDGELANWANPSAEFRAYTSGEEKLAYEAINTQIGTGRPSNPDCPLGNNTRFDIRTAYARVNQTQLTSWKTCVERMAQPVGVSSAVWTSVRGQIEGELLAAAQVASWFGKAGYLDSLVKTAYLSNSLDPTADILKFEQDSRERLQADQMEMFEGIVGGFALFEPLESTVYASEDVLGAATAAGLGLQGVDDALDPVSEAYSELKERQRDDFNDAEGGLSKALAAIQEDYGLQTNVGGLIFNASWEELGEDLDAAIAGANHNYALTAYQTLIPALWTAYRIPDRAGPPPNTSRNYGDFWCEGECDRREAGAWWTIAYSDSCDASGPCHDKVPSAIKQRLFGSTAPSCTTKWTPECRFGLPVNQVYDGEAGWQNLPLRDCEPGGQFPKLFCPRVRPAG